jgi:hypothetical protein
MGANLAMDPAAVLTDPRHLNAQRLTDGTATLSLPASYHLNMPRSQNFFSGSVVGLSLETIFSFLARSPK